MAKMSFARLKQEFDDACTFLRGFTLAHQGYKAKDGVAGIKRLGEVCDKLNKLSGSEAGQAVPLVATGRTRIAAANARLNLLAKKV